MLGILLTQFVADMPINESLERVKKNVSDPVVVQARQELNFVDMVKYLKALPVTTIAPHVPLDHPLYAEYSLKADSFLNPEGSFQCAKFVNRLFSELYHRQMWGNAWELPLQRENKEFLNLVWQIPEESFKRDGLLRLKDKQDRVRHFTELYAQLDTQSHPQGVIGFVFRFSAFREYLADKPHFLPQTHVAYVAGQKSFEIKNEHQEVLTIQEVLEKEYGWFYDYEIEFLASKLPLQRMMNPEESYRYEDYLIEENFHGLQNVSLLEVFFRREDRKDVTYPQLRPVSYSKLGKGIIDEIRHQEVLYEAIGGVDFIRGAEWEAYDELTPQEKDIWADMLQTTFGIENISRAEVIPVPKK